MAASPKTKFDVSKSPLTAIWETTQACEVACLDFSDQAQPERDLLELSTDEAKAMIRDVAELQPPIFIFTGADPLMRDDIYELVHYADRRGLHPVMTLSATPRVTRNASAELKHAGLSRLVLRLEGSTPELHDRIAGVSGSFVGTTQAIRWAQEWMLPLQIQTNLCRANLGDLENLASLLKRSRILVWNIIFPVPGGRWQKEDLPSAEEFEQAFATIYALAQKVPFKIKTTEAQHYRRFVLQQTAAAEAAGLPRSRGFDQGIPGVLPVNEANATVFISSTGEVFPSPCLPVSAGNVRLQNVAELYRQSELFTSLRDQSRLQGNCGHCGYTEVCGGSRARAYALTGDMFADDQFCVHKPEKPVASQAAKPKPATKLKIVNP